MPLSWPAPGSLETLSSLETYLRTNYPRDILTPCAVGDKRPLSAYSKGAWSWEKFDAFKASKDEMKKRRRRMG